MKSNIADEMPEPSNGTWLVIKEGSSSPRVIWRDDDSRPGWAHEDERWFDDVDQDGLGWHEAMKYADVVYGVTMQPIYTR